MGKPERDSSSDVRSDSQQELPAASGLFRCVQLEHDSSEQAAEERRPVSHYPEHRADAWGDCSRAYDAFSEGVTRPFAEDAVRLVRVGAETSVLDVAAGTGAFALAAAQRGAHVLATDFSSKMIDELERKCRCLGLARVRGEQMDGQALSIADESFDVAASLFGIMFFPDVERGFSELFRVVKPGGRAIVASWSRPARVEMMRLLGEATMQALRDVPLDFEPPAWVGLSDARELRQRLLACGFARAHVVSVAHVWTFERAELLAEILPFATPSSAALFSRLSEQQRESFVNALVEDLCERQGEGPYAVTNEGLIAVASKAA